MKNKKSPFSVLRPDSDLEHRFEVVETAWNSDSEVKAALKLLKSKQDEFFKKAGFDSLSKREISDFQDDYYRWISDSIPTEISVFTSVYFKNY
jgi:hypothetical protein